MRESKIKLCHIFTLFIILILAHIFTDRSSPGLLDSSPEPGGISPSIELCEGQTLKRSSLPKYTFIQIDLIAFFSFLNLHHVCNFGFFQRNNCRNSKNTSQYGFITIRSLHLFICVFKTSKLKTL